MVRITMVGMEGHIVAFEWDEKEQSLHKQKLPSSMPLIITTTSYGTLCVFHERIARFTTEFITSGATLNRESISTLRFKFSMKVINIIP
jgi:hypothetical protein